MKKILPQIVLVTGASSGLGRAAALALVAQGHTVYGTSRRVCDDLKAVKWCVMDVSNETSVEAVVSSIIAEQGRIDVLVNVAGVGTGGALELTTKEEYEWTFNTNVLGILNTCRAVLPHMRQRRMGKIINVSSIAGMVGVPYQGLYSASKFAVEGLSEAYVLELKTFGIKVCLVEPGDFATNFTINRSLSQLTKENADYSEIYERSMAIIEKSENAGARPELMARKVCALVNAKNPPFRNLVGPAAQVIPTKLLAFIPTKLAHYILRNMYAVD